MLPLHDTTRRRLCVSGFVLLAVLPTLLAGAWCIGRHLPGCVETEAELLGRQIGLEVRLGGVKYLRPGAMLYERLEACDPETGRTVFRSRLLEVAFRERSGEKGEERAIVEMTASQPEIETASLDRVWRCIERALESRPGGSCADLVFSAGELTLRSSDDSQTLTDVQGLTETLAQGTRAQLCFRLAGSNTPEPARIQVTRNRQVSPPASGFELYTGGGELPCNVLAMGIKELKPLGSRCRFHGYIWANQSPVGWEGEVTGQLVELDIGSLVTENFPHRLSGVGEVTIERARFRHGRLEEGNAIITAGPGAIDRSLIDAAVSRLGLVAAPDAQASPLREAQGKNERVPYQQLALSATLDTDGLRLRGRCATGGIGTILCDARGRILGEPSQASQTMAALVQTLVPESVVQVPASRQTDWLLRHLPLPDAAPARTAERPRVRLPDTWKR